MAKQYKQPRFPSVMKHQFSEVPRADIPRSSFDRSHGYKTTFDAGYLIPIFVDEALPGDTFNLKMTGFARMATPIFPLMDNAYMETFFFAVPIRLIWDNWEKFNGAQANPTDSTDYTIPTINTSGAGFAEGSISDYFGIPTGPALGPYVSALPYRAYNLIFNEWFRDQNIDNSITVNTDDGPDAITDYQLMRRRKRHDYFTSCLPWPQKGDSVSVSLGGLADVIPDTSTTPYIRGETDTEGVIRTFGTNTSGQVTISGANPPNDLLIWPSDTNLQADLSNATAVTINALRQSFQIQKLLERDARGGTRYTEVIRAHFGVTSPDARLQRPEYLGGGSSPIIINPVAQTSSTDATTPQGNLSAVGTAHLLNHGFVKSFTEHCILIGMVNVRADLSYQQGLERMWSRSTRYDFYWPALAHIGEQAVLSREIYADGTDTAAADGSVFGYQERFAEYRYKQSKITGKFRSNATGTLDAWHLAQEFGSRPTLNTSFIVENPPFDRVIAVPTEPHFIFDSYFSMRCARPMPLYGVPGFTDRF